MTTEVWKKVPGYDDYEISNKERIKTISINKIREFKECNKQLTLVEDNKRYNLYFNRIVALAFIPNPENLPFVVHINGKSNVPENLKWSKTCGGNKKGKKRKDTNCVPLLRLDDKGNTLERYENRKSMIEWVRKNCDTNTTDKNVISNISRICNSSDNISYGYKWKYEFIEIEGEEWKKHPEEKFNKYDFSNMGRCKFVTRLLTGNLSTDGYVKIMGNYLHKLIAQTFLLNPDNLPEVDHINGNRSDNKVCNLRWCTRKQNNEYAHNKKVFQYSKDRKTFIKEFKSIGKASEELNTSGSHIGQCANNKRNSCAGFWWSYTKI